MHWTLGVLIGLPITAVVVIGLILAAIYFFRDSYGFEIGLLFAGFAAIVLGSVALGMYPYKAEYHQWRPVEGTVQQVDKRMVKDGDGMSERYAVTINDTVYGVDDTRASTLREGSHVRLSCIKEWQWAASDGYGCRWGE